MVLVLRSYVDARTSTQYFIPRSVYFACMRWEGPDGPYEKPVRCNVRFTGTPFVGINSTSPLVEKKTFNYKYDPKDSGSKFALADFPPADTNTFTQLNVSAVPEADHRGTYLIALDSFTYTAVSNISLENP